MAMDPIDQWLDRWASVTTLDKTSECWVFQGAVNRRGYATVGVGGKTFRLARFIYSELFGDPGPLVVDHTCHNESDCRAGELCQHRRCWNPDHLVAKTNAQNKADGAANGRYRQTHCKRGHELTPENCYVAPDGHRRYCKPCFAARVEERRCQQL